MANRSLSVSDWHILAQEGTKLPVRTLIAGYSMEPLIRCNKDYVTIMPSNGELAIGDIVLFSDPYKERYVLHRVWRLDGQKVLTWGDNCDVPDAWMQVSDVWGKAVLIERGKHKIKPDPGKGMLYAKIWHFTGSIYRKGWKIAAKVYHGLLKRRR